MLKLFCSALRLYTRLPCPPGMGGAQTQSSNVLVFLPIIGWLIGGASGITFFYTAQYFSTFTAALMSLCVSLLLSGAIHERQLALWFETSGRSESSESSESSEAQTNKEKEKPASESLRKQPVTGFSAVLGLSLALLLKVSLIDDAFFLHGYLRDEWIIVTLIFICTHTLSRFTINAVVYFGHTAEISGNQDSFSSPLFLLSGLLALAPLVALIKLSYSPHYVLLLPPIALLTWRLYDHCKKKRGGYTQGTLGAVQQINELLCYALFALIL